MSEKQTTISLEGVDLLEFLGRQDTHLRRLEDHFPGTLVVRGNSLILRGPTADVEEMERIVEQLVDWARSGRAIDASAIGRLLGGRTQLAPAGVPVGATSRGKIRARTPGQARYLEAIASHEVVFAIGPAGTGKTYLAVFMAVGALQRGEVDRIVLVRPAVEAGEQLGFLPGDLQEKIDPYLRPLYDALNDCLGSAKLSRLLTNGTVEVAPLAYMRGRTLSRSFVILDEGQNTTLMQMKMFLTRIGEGTRAVVTGDVTQIDLPEPGASGLVRVREILHGVDGVCFLHLRDSDVVRHPLVQRIVAAFSGSEDVLPSRSVAQEES